MMFGEPITGLPINDGRSACPLAAFNLSIGLMGEYIGRIFIETKNRPL